MAPMFGFFFNNGIALSATQAWEAIVPCTLLLDAQLYLPQFICTLTLLSAVVLDLMIQGHPVDFAITCC